MLYPAELRARLLMIELLYDIGAGREEQASYTAGEQGTLGVLLCGLLIGVLDGGWIGYGSVEERDLLDEVEAGAPEHLVDAGLGEAAGVVLDPDGFFGFVERNAADAIDLTQAGDGHGRRFGGRDTVAIEDVKLGHRAMIAASGRAVDGCEAARALRSQALRSETFEVVHDLGAGPDLSADELSPQDAIAVDDVGLRNLDGAVERVDALIAVADGDEIDVMLDEEAAVDVVILIGADADDGELWHGALQGEEAGQLLDAGSAVGGPKIEDDDTSVKAGEVESLDAVADGEEGSGAAEVIGVISAIATCGEKERETGCAGDERPGSTHEASSSYNTELWKRFLD